MFNNPKFADIKITIRDIDVLVYRFVLCLQSEYFSNALDRAFIEGLTNTLTCRPRKEYAYLRVLSDVIELSQANSLVILSLTWP